MDSVSLRDYALRALKAGKMLTIMYNNTARDVLPISFRTGRMMRDKMYAWCVLDPLIPAEAFLCSKVMWAEVSKMPISYHPPLENELWQVDGVIR